METAPIKPQNTIGADDLSNNSENHRPSSSGTDITTPFLSLSLNWPVVLFCLLALFLPLLYWPFAFNAAGVPRETLLSLGAGAGLVLFAVQTFRTAKPVAWHPLQMLLLLFLCWAIASLYWSVDRGSSFLAITQLVSLILLALLATQLSSETVQRYLLPAALISAILVALIGIGQYLGFNPLSLRQSSPPASTFLNKNYAANYLDLLVPIALAMLLSQSRPSKPLALLAATAFATGMGFLVISQTRGSWLGLLVAAIALIVACLVRRDLRKLLFKTVRLHRHALLISLIVVLLLTFAEYRVIPEGATVGKLESIMSLTPDHSIQTRLDTYLNTAAGFLDQPWLGVGYGAFVTGFNPYVAAVKPVEIITQNYTMLHAHNDPLQIFFEVGLPGGLLAITVYLLTIMLAWRIVTSAMSVPVRLIGLGLMLALLASGAHALVDFPLRLPTSAFFFWLWVGLVIGLYMHTGTFRHVKISRTILIATGLFGLLFTFHTANLYYHYFRANSDILTAKLHVLNNNCAAAFKATDRAMNEFGIDHLTRFWYVKVYTYCDAPSNDKLRAMDRALANDPNLPLARLTRAQIQLADNYLLGAARDFNEYRKLLPHRPEGYSGLVSIALRLNKLDKARELLKEALLRVQDNSQLQKLNEHLNSDLRD